MTTQVLRKAPRSPALSSHVVRALGDAMLASLGLEDAELSVLLTDDRRIQELNREHRDKDKPTDVLSFPLDAADDAPPTPGVPILLGDIVVCPEVAAEAAPQHAGTLDDELALLVVHGVLHILGHDHAEPEETATMRAAELDHLTRLYWHGPAPDGFRQEQAPHAGAHVEGPTS